MKTVYLGNDFECESVITQRNAATSTIEPATGLTGLTFRLSATDDGAAVDTSLSVSAVERATTLGTYYAVFQGDDLTAHATTLAGTTAYIVFGDGINVLTSEPVQIQATRRPG